MIDFFCQCQLQSRPDKPQTTLAIHALYRPGGLAPVAEAKYLGFRIDLAPSQPAPRDLGRDSF